MERPARRTLPPTRQSITHKFDIKNSEGEHKGYITVGMYEDRTPGEVFIKMDKQGSLTSGLLDGIAILISILLQHGIPLNTICDKLSRMSFEPAGATNHDKIRRCSSMLDYVARWLDLKFNKPEAVPEEVKNGNEEQPK